MGIITISRGSFFHAKAVAEKLAEKLGYRCLSRDQIIDQLEEFHLPEMKLVRGLNDAFSVLDRFPHGKKRYKVAVKSTILSSLLKGNVVYHGLVGHHFLQEISHVLKVRIIADTEERVAADMKRENTDENESRFILKKDDEERRKWGMFLYGIDIHDPQNYDLIININDLSEDEAVDIIATTSQLDRFKETEESISLLRDSALKSQICAKLFDFPNASVAIVSGVCTVSLKIPENQQPLIKERIDEMLGSISNLKEYSLKFEKYY